MTTEFDVVAGAVAAACGGAAFTPPAADARGPLDWSRIARLVGRHRVLPLAASGFGAAAPDALRASWRAELGPHAQRSLHLLATAGAIASRFDAAGIRALAVKGPVLAVVGYGDPLRRSYGDLDFWVARADLVRAAECLAAEGYTLLGGRLLVAGGQPAAQLMYEDQSKRRITLFLIANSGNSETAIRIEQSGPLSACYWLDGPLGFAVAGELDRDQMMALAHEVYRQFES